MENMAASRPNRLRARCFIGRAIRSIARGETALLAIEHDKFLARLVSGDPSVRTL
jgi:hypothetical protein